MFLALAIVSEVAATSALKAAHGFTQWGPSLLVVLGYAFSFAMLGQVVKTVPLGVAYAIWSGLGIVGTSLIALWLYGQKPDFAAILGMGLILAGAVIIYLFSRTAV